MGSILTWQYEETELTSRGYREPLQMVGLHGRRRSQGNGRLPGGGGLAGSGGCV